MKSIVFTPLAIFFTAFSVIFYFESSNADSERTLLMQENIRDTLKYIQRVYSIEYKDIFESGQYGPHGPYSVIDLSFNVPNPLTKEEGRRIIVDITEVLLKQINSDEKLRPHLTNYPFTCENIRIKIFDSQPDGNPFYFPIKSVVWASNGKIKYKTKSPEKRFSYFSEEEESYQDALNIVKSQET